MKKITVLIFCLSFTNLFSQKFLWKAEVKSFFDNCEFDASKVTSSQTMGGTRFVPEVGIFMEDYHKIFVGIDAMHEFGSIKAIDYYDPIVYYHFLSENFRFYTGAFPRRLILERYPRMFFADSIKNYRPNVNGIFWEYHSAKNFFNIWMDWTGRQSYTERETFFLGWQGRYKTDIFYLQQFGYLFHFAGFMYPDKNDNVHDNALVLTSLGVDFSSKTNFDELDLNVGLSYGFDKERKIDKLYQPFGLLSELRVEYKGLGIFNSLYVGQGQQNFYSDHQNNLYWGDPFYRNDFYNRTDLYIYFFKNESVKLKMIYSLHFTEQKMFHQQAFYASVVFCNFNNKEQKKNQYIWDKWLKNKQKE